MDTGLTVAVYTLNSSVVVINCTQFRDCILEYPHFTVQYVIIQEKQHSFQPTEYIT